MASLHEVAKCALVSQDDIKSVLQSIMGIVKGGEDVRIQGFGTFKRTTRKGRTIKSKELPGGQVTYEDFDTMTFKASGAVKELFND